MKTRIKVRGAGLTGCKQAARLVKRGRARWVSDSEIEIIAEDRTELPSYFNPPNFHRTSPTTLPVIQNVTDAYPGMPVLWTIGYRRSTPGLQLTA